jgi:hypothetical protein
LPAILKGGGPVGAVNAGGIGAAGAAEEQPLAAIPQNIKAAAIWILVMTLSDRGPI